MLAERVAFQGAERVDDSKVAHERILATRRWLRRRVVTKRCDVWPLSADMLTGRLWRAGAFTAKINVLFPN